ncbi:MAG: hypothetical protein ACI8RD_003570 [Bacillariaceae sp.]|jgi:hypothetical protein
MFSLSETSTKTIQKTSQLFASIPILFCTLRHRMESWQIVIYLQDTVSSMVMAVVQFN